MFGTILLLVLFYESFSDVYVTMLLEDFWTCLKYETRIDDDDEDVQTRIAACKNGLNIVPVLYSVWSVHIMLFSLAILIFKKSEDYIARYS